MKLDWKSCLIACASLFLLFLACEYWGNIASLFGVVLSAAWTLMIGSIIAYVVNIIMSFYERHIAPQSKSKLWQKARRPLCMVLAFLTVVFVLMLLVRLIVPELARCFTKLLNALPGAADSVMNWLEEWMADKDSLQQYIDTLETTIPQDAEAWREWLLDKTDVLISGLGGVMNFAFSFTTQTFGTIITIFMALIFACNILMSKEKLADQFGRLSRRVLGGKLTGHVHHALNVINDCFHSYIVGQLIEAIILGTLCTLGMWIFQLPYAVMIGALIGVMALIPIAGAYIGAAIGAIMIFSEDPVKALIFLIFLVVLQQIEGNLIYPRTVGSTLHLPGIWVLASVTLGGAIMGVMGMIFFVPMTAAIYRLLGEWVRQTDRPSLVEAIVSFDDNVPQIVVIDDDDVPATPKTPEAAQPVKAIPQQTGNRKSGKARRR